MSDAISKIFDPTKVKTFELKDLVNRTLIIKAFIGDSDSIESDSFHTRLTMAIDRNSGDCFVLDSRTIKGNPIK